MQGGFHGATCVPSRAMLLSGRSLFQIDEKLERDETWPAAFARSGYSTFISGKWHNGRASLPLCFQQGKSVFLGGMVNPMRAKVSDLIDGKIGPTKEVSKHACEEFADRAIEFIRQQSQPFFCYVPFDGPHDPHIVPDEFSIRYRPEDMPLPRISFHSIPSITAR